MSRKILAPIPPCPFRDRAEGRWHLVRVLPTEPPTRDPVHITDPVHGWWAAYEALDGWSQKPLKGVWRRWCERPLDDDPLELLIDVLWHPETPFGIGWKPDWMHPAHAIGKRRIQMYVTWRGKFFIRTDSGVLHSTHERINWWPSPHDLEAAVRQALAEEGEA